MSFATLRNRLRISAALVLYLALVQVAFAQVDFQSTNAQWSFHSADPVVGSDVPEFDLGFLAPAFELTGSRRFNLNCLVTAKRDGVKVRLNGTWLGGGVVDLVTGEQLFTFSQKFNHFSPDARFSWGFTDLSDKASAANGLVGVALAGEIDGTDEVDSVFAQCRWQMRLPCQEGATRACIFGNSRFQVEVLLANGKASVLNNAPIEATFDLQDPNAEDLRVRLVNGCGANNHFQISAKSKSQVGHLIKILDTQTGVEVTYDHVAGTPFEDFLDEAAFPTCP